MTEEERKHRQRMLDHSRMIGQARVNELINRKRPLTPEELAQAIIDLKRKFPQDFPK